MRRAVILLLYAAAVAGSSATAAAQGVRGAVSSTARYLELRPLRLDTIPSDLATELGNGAFSIDGLPAECGPVVCTVFRAGRVEHGIVATQDADLTLWGLGVQGLSGSLLLRSQAHLQGEFRPPRSDELLEAILAYGELSRGMVRLRAGRQRELSGLGFVGYDGVDLLIEPSRRLHAQLFGGRSLARAVQQPLARAFRAADDRDFLPDENAYLLGGELGLESAGGSTLAVRYQGEVWGDRSGLLSERALLTGRTAVLRPLVLAAAIEYDAGLGRLGKAFLDIQTPLPVHGLAMAATLRRHVPFFEYWTIWGLFSPAAYHELELRATWLRSPALALWGTGAYRRYGAHETQTFLQPLTSRSVRIGAGADWRASEDLLLGASVRAEGPTGAFSIGTDVVADWRVSSRLGVGVHGSLLEQVEEFRLGSGVVGGGGVRADFGLTRQLWLSGGVELYRHVQRDRPARPDWTQRRGWIGARMEVGRDPGLAGREGQE
jgi:hypothetical protein